MHGIFFLLQERYTSFFFNRVTLYCEYGRHCDTGDPYSSAEAATLARGRTSSQALHIMFSRSGNQAPFTAAAVNWHFSMLVPEDSATRAVRAAHRRRHESPHLASAASKRRRMCVCVCEYVRFQDDQRFSYLVRRHMKLTAPRARRLWGRLRYRSRRSAGETPPRRSATPPRTP